MQPVRFKAVLQFKAASGVIFKKLSNSLNVVSMKVCLCWLQFCDSSLLANFKLEIRLWVFLGGESVFFEHGEVQRTFCRDLKF